MELIKSYYPTNIKINIEKKTLNEEIKHSILSELEDKTFIKDELQELLKSHYYYQISYKNIIFNSLPAPCVKQSLLKKIIKRIDTLIQIYKMKLIPITIWLIPTESKRIFPQKGAHIQPIHINGGYTYISNHTIYVYRCEEFAKVILHEVLHNSVLQIKWSYEKLMELYKFLNIQDEKCNEYICETRLEPEEAIIEVWALYYQIMFQAYERKIDLMTLFNEELNWSLYQTKKLLSYKNKYYQNGWKEDTHAYSYIFLKTIFLYFWNDFSKIQMPYTDKIITEFIINHKDSEALQEAIKYSKNYKTKSFRMTRFGDL